VAFDNLSGIAPHLSDALCCLATGGGFATRELYSDDAEKLFSAMRPILCNGIDDVSTRPDLLDRSIVLTLAPIRESDRLCEANLWRDFHDAAPAIVGALLDAVSVALAGVSSVRLERLRRMADFATWVAAAAPALPWKPGDFLSAYAGNRESANATAIEASPIGPAIVGMMHDRESWQGTARELLAEISTERYSDERTRRRRDWPGTPQRIRAALLRVASNLRASGIEVTLAGPTGHQNKRLIHLGKGGIHSVASVASVAVVANPPGASENADSVRPIARASDLNASARDLVKRSQKNGDFELETAFASAASAVLHTHSDEDEPPHAAPADLIDSGAFVKPGGDGEHDDWTA